MHVTNAEVKKTWKKLYKRLKAIYISMSVRCMKVGETDLNMIEAVINALVQ